MKLLLAGIAVMIGACGITSPQDCTLIGCTNGLAVVVNTSLQQQMTVTVKAGTQTLATLQCSAGTPCNTFIENQTPSEVQVTINVSGGTVNRTYNPQYQMHRPNGENCPPECKQATITVNVS